LDVLGQQQSDNPETNLFSIEFNLQCSIESQAPINMFSSHSSRAELHVKEQDRSRKAGLREIKALEGKQIALLYPLCLWHYHGMVSGERLSPD